MKTLNTMKTKSFTKIILTFASRKIAVKECKQQVKFLNTV